MEGVDEEVVAVTAVSPPAESPPGPQPGSGPAAVAGVEDLLGLRIVAALIDLAIVGVLSVVIGATIGEASVEGGSFSNDLGGVGLALFVGLAFLYYFVLEAALGRTVGKLLVGLRVVGSDAGRPSVWAVGLSGWGSGGPLVVREIWCGVRAVDVVVSWC